MYEKVVSTKGRKVGSKNIDWPKSIQRFMIFRKQNDLNKMKREAVHELFLQKTEDTMDWSSFRKLKTEVKKFDEKMKEMMCPVCHLSQFDLERDEVAIFKPTCDHDVCASCLSSIFKHNKVCIF